MKIDSWYKICEFFSRFAKQYTLRYFYKTGVI